MTIILMRQYTLFYQIMQLKLNEKSENEQNHEFLVGEIVYLVYSYNQSIYFLNKTQNSHR